MEKENKELLLKYLCMALPYEIKFLREAWNYEWDQEISVIEVLEDIDKDGYINNTKVYKIEDIKPYLRSMSSMTEEEATEIASLCLLDSRNILSIKIKDEYLDVTVDDGVSSTETIILWYDELISSIECLFWLLEYHFDFMGLIPKGLAIPVTEENNPYKK